MAPKIQDGGDSKQRLIEHLLALWSLEHYFCFKVKKYEENNENKVT